MNRQQQLAAIFADTQDMIANTPQLKEAARRSAEASHLYEANDWPELGEPTGEGLVRVTGRRSFEAAQVIAAERPDARIAVHNFASSIHPGGGVVAGSSAQEESLCRCSTLYSALDQRRFWNAYYSPNRGSGDVLATDACIWTPDVVICKSDESLPARLAPEQWISVDVVTCAAPDLRRTSANLAHLRMGRTTKVSLTELFDLHRQRARHLLTIAASEGAQCLVLGAFGCGAFCNDPYLVASAWHQELEPLRNHFDLVEFAVFHMPYERENFDAFSAEFED